jgi:diguanylate cyclase (GGDEF)-like protein
MQLSKRIMAATFCLIVMLSLAISQSAIGENSGEALTVGVPIDRCPVFYLDAATGEITGIGVDLMRSAAENSGYIVSFQAISEATLKDALDNDTYDIVMPFGSAITSSAGNQSIVSDNLIQTPFTLITEDRREMPPLSDISVGMLQSLGGAAETVRQLFPGIEITMYETMDECVKALREGKVDALLHNSYVWSYVLQKPSYSDLVVQPSAMFSMDFRAGTKDTPEGHLIIERLNGGIAALTDTRRQAIVLDHTSRRLYKYDLSDYLYQYGLVILLVVLLITAIIVIAIQRIHTVRKEQEKKLRYDNLTGLPRMSYFFELAQASRGRVREKGGTPVLMYVDFSGMKFFNTKYGFFEGDNLLRAFANILSSTFGNEHCCRISADHFAVQTEKTGLDDKLQELFDQCRGMNDGKNLPVHIGVYTEESEQVHVSIACDRAKMACSELSGRYETAVNYYSHDLSEDAEKRQYIIENLDRAIEEKWIKLYLQPIIRAVNGQVCDVEALARWIDPEKGFLSPADFIPVLEDAGLIYKLDLYMVDQVLEAIKVQKVDGFNIIPHSINLSRSDFTACDIVEEIRKRVEAAGVSRDRITIEITESVIGRDFDFMKEQVERFQKLGFPVWMDDFGSGYSSLEVLQNIRFDLLKFDMSLMRKLDEGEAGKTMLTELMRMATSLGMDTVCEGVETEKQVRFLQEIGCSKLQGYYYSKPIPFESIREMFRSGTLIQNENPAESDYYESIGKANLFDLGVIAGDVDNAFQNVFESLPIAVLEVRDGKARYIRSNRSYQDFVRRFFDVDILETQKSFRESAAEYGTNFSTVIRQCCDTENRAFFDEKMPDGSVVHAFARRISINPVTSCVAVALAVLSIAAPDEERTTYAEIAQSLAADYYNIFVINLDTNDYIEYSSQVGDEKLSLLRHGGDFFESARRDTMTRIYAEDRAQFLALFTKENVLRDIDRQGVFTTMYRLIDTGTPMYVNMKITRMKGSNRLILGVSIIDAHMKEKERFEQMQKEREMLVRIMALSDGYLTMFTVDPKTGSFIEYSSSEDFDSLGAKKEGDDFFRQAYVDAFTHCYAEDRQRFQEQVTLENVLNEIRLHGKFSINYRLIIKGEPVPVTLKASLFKDGDDDKLVVGVRAWNDRH